MAWNEPGGRNNDPWGGNGRGDQGPPDMDEAFRKLQSQLNSIFGRGGGGSGSGGSRPGALFYGIVAGALVLLYLASGLIQVDEQERGVVFRFGKVRDQVLTPGLQWYPRFIESVRIVNVMGVDSYNHVATMLTRDDNIVKVNMKVQYRRENPIDYVTNVRDPETSIAHSAESALRHVVGSSSMDDVLTTGRAAIAAETQERTQSYLDNYGTGIRVVQVTIDETSAPDQVLEAFNDVQRAREDQVRAINEANAYVESIMPEARGEAQQTVEQANAYRDQVIARAEGEASRFNKVMQQYRLAPGVTRDRLYIDAVQQVLSQSGKVLIDVEGGNNMMYLPLDKLGSVGAGSGTDAMRITPDTVRQITDAVVRELQRRTPANRRETR